MITVVRDKFPGLAACFNDARALRELMPDAFDLYVKEFGWCAHCESSVRSIPIFLVGRGRDEFIAEFRDKALSGPRTGFVCVEFVNVVEGATDVSSLTSSGNSVPAAHLMDSGCRAVPKTGHRVEQIFLRSLFQSPATHL